MAVSKAWTIKTGVKDSVDYVANPDKTSVMKYIKNETKTVYGDKLLISGWHCNPQTAEAEFRMREEAYHRVKRENIAKGIQPNQAIHIIQSFSAKDSANMTPDELHQYGIEFAGMICGDHFQAVVASHLNHSDQLHNHIVVNAYALDGIYKFIEDRECVKRIRELNDTLCKSHSLEIIVPERMDKVANYKEWQEKQDGTSWKEAIRSDIKEVMKITNNWYDYKTTLENAGYVITENKNSISYKAPGCPYTVRDMKLGEQYTREAMMEFWEERARNMERDREEDRERTYDPEELLHDVKPINKEKDQPEIHVDAYDSEGRRRSAIEIFLLKVIKKLKFIKKKDPKANEPKKIDSAVYGRVDWKIQNMLDTLAIAKENNIRTQEDLADRLDELGKNRNNLRQKLNGDNIEIQNMAKTIQAINEYFELEEIVDNLNIDSYVLNIPMPDKDTILAARAEQDPMTKKQKMDLYKAMEEENLKPDGYKLDVKFNQLSRADATDVIAFLKDDTLPRPPQIITLEEFEAKRELAKSGAIEDKKLEQYEAKLEKVPASPKQKIAVANLMKKNPQYQLKREVVNSKDANQIINFFKNNGPYPEAFVSEKDRCLDKLDPEEKMTVKAYLELKQKLYSLGLTDETKIADFKAELKEKINTFAAEKEEFNKMGKQYAKYKRVEYNLELAKNPVYTHFEEKIVETELEDDKEIDREVEETRRTGRAEYREKDEHFHYDEEER